MIVLLIIVVAAVIGGRWINEYINGDRDYPRGRKK